MEESEMKKVSTLKFGDLYMCNSAWNEDTYIELLDDSENTLTCKARRAYYFFPDAEVSCFKENQVIFRGRVL